MRSGNQFKVLLSKTFFLCALFTPLLCAANEKVQLTSASKPKSRGTSSRKKLSAVPRLIVILTIDQMRADTLDRYTPAMKKLSSGRLEGLLAMRDAGVWFSDAWTASAPTVTAAGHASICTGANPSKHGIVGNEIFDPKRRMRIGSTEDDSVKMVKSSEVSFKDPLSRVPAEGSSRKRLKTENFADVIHRVSRGKAKSVSISIKDRGAVYCASAHSAGTYWYDYSSGGMVSSTAFAQALPAWVNAFNAKLPGRFPSVWSPLLSKEEMKASLESEAAQRAFGVRSPISQWFGEGFPYQLSTGDSADVMVRQRFPYTPAAVQFLVDFGLEAIVQERLGCRSRVENKPCLSGSFPDLLTISFSTTDLVGHAFGPESPELMDIYLNLNKSLERLQTALKNIYGERQVLFVVTSDHGVQSLPEVRSLNGEGGGRSVAKELKSAFEKNLTEAWGEGPWIDEIVTGEIHFNQESLLRKKKAPKEAIELLKNHIRSVPGIRGILSREEILKGGKDETELYRRGHDIERSGDAVILFLPGWTQDNRNAANHGTAFEEDARIPILFSGWGVHRGIVRKGRVRADDIVPTLIDVLNLPKPAYITGRSLMRDVFVPQSTWDK